MPKHLTHLFFNVRMCVCVCVRTRVRNPIDGSPPGFSVHGFSQQEYWIKNMKQI